MKKSSALITVFIFLISSFSLESCASNKLIPIPGEEKAILNNLYVEYSNIGDTYYNLEQYSNAIKYYEMAMKNRKLYWSSYYKLAKCYALTSDWNNALPMYEKMLKRDKDNSSLKASLAYIYTMQGEIKEAEKIYKELLDLEPENATYIENYIAILMPDEESYKKNQEEIESLFTKLKTDFPDNKNIERLKYTIEKYTPKEEASEEKTN